MLRSMASAKILICGLQSKKDQQDTKTAVEKLANLAHLVSGVKDWFTGSNQDEQNEQDKQNKQKEQHEQKEL